MKTNYELIFVLANQGYTDDIMEAAKANGARGGTILTARGSGNEEAEKNYGVVITPNKELIMILVHASKKEAIINAIYKEAGIETPAMGIIWSTPADNIVGIKPEKIEEPEEESTEEKVEKAVKKAQKAEKKAEKAEKKAEKAEAVAKKIVKKAKKAAKKNKKK